MMLKHSVAWGTSRNPHGSLSAGQLPIAKQQTSLIRIRHIQDLGLSWSVHKWWKLAALLSLLSMIILLGEVLVTYGPRKREISWNQSCWEASHSRTALLLDQCDTFQQNRARKYHDKDYCETGILHHWSSFYEPLLIIAGCSLTSRSFIMTINGHSLPLCTMIAQSHLYSLSMWHDLAFIITIFAINH